MKFKIKFTPQAQNDYEKLDHELKELLDKDYQTIETMGTEYVFIKSLEHSIFEIKTKNIRSLFKYQENQIMIIGLIFKKETPKTPKQIKKIAIKRLKEY